MRTIQKMLAENKMQTNYRCWCFISAIGWFRWAFFYFLFFFLHDKLFFIFLTFSFPFVSFFCKVFDDLILSSLNMRIRCFSYHRLMFMVYLFFLTNDLMPMKIYRIHCVDKTNFILLKWMMIVDKRLKHWQQ